MKLRAKGYVMRTIFVTGAAGGIGSVLVPHLAKQGDQVICLDDLSSGSWKNIQDHPNVEFVTGSILDLDLLNELNWEEFTHIIHLAAISSLPACQINPGLAISTNVQGTANIAQLATLKSKKLKLFINASTSAVYESNKEQPLTEDLQIEPHLIYPLTKKFTEELLFAMSKDYKFPCISFRFFNVFGPMQDYERKSPPLLNYLVREMINNSQPILHSDGNQARDYISVNDICDGIQVALNHEFSKYENFNLCSGQQFSVNEIVEIVSNSLKTNIDPVFRSAEKLWNAYDELFAGHFPLDKGAVENETLKSSLGSSEKFTAHTGWRPATNQSELIGQTALLARDHILN